MNILKKAASFVITVVITAVILASAAFGASYTVQSGDSLYKIGMLFNTSADVIRNDNKLPGNMIYPGQSSMCVPVHIRSRAAIHSAG